MTKKVPSRWMLLLLVLSSMTFAFQGKPPQLPAPYHTPSASNAPKVIPRPDGAQLSLPKGFTAEVFAEGLKTSLHGFAPGEVLISDSVVDKGTVYVLRTETRTARLNPRELIDGLDRPTAWLSEGLSVRRRNDLVETVQVQLQCNKG
jgi:hypothetical protein